MMRPLFVLPLAGFALLLLLFAAGLYTQLSGSRQPDQLPSMLVGQLPPDRPLPGLNAEPPRRLLDASRGDWLLVNFFASWCAPCRAEAPALANLSEKMTIIGIAYKDKPLDTQKFLNQFGNPYRRIGVDLDGKAGLDWAIYGVPESFLLAPDGRVVLRHAGPVDRALLEDIEARLETGR